MALKDSRMLMFFASFSVNYGVEEVPDHAAILDKIVDKAMAYRSQTADVSCVWC